MDIKYDFVRYLLAKKTVDDRALNKDVWHTFQRHLLPNPRILEIGAGVGTMIERLVEHEFIQQGSYTAVDNQPQNIAIARQRLQHLPPRLHVTLEADDLFAFAAHARQKPQWDVLIAHAFLDLMNIPAALPVLFSLLKPGGLFYFSVNFDGATILEPTIDPAFDALVERLYHQTMDTRLINGRLSGDSHSGRHLFHHLQANGATILTAGSSDWVVFAGDDGYLADEAYFLHFIVHTIDTAVRDHPEINNEQLNRWTAQRHTQIEHGELVYIAHQLDFLGRYYTN